MAIGYLTLDTIPPGTQCRVLLLPDSVDWIAIITGALEVLTEPESWQKYGALTPEQCAEVMRQMIDEFTFNGACPP